MLKTRSVPYSLQILVVLFISALVAPGWLYAQESKARKNVLLICVDDLKPALGCYGDTLAQTPNIDRLAATGVSFRNAYCNQAVCSPSRNALLSGLRPQSLGIYDLGTNLRKANREIVTLPEYFKKQGYRSEGMGKIFHVGHGNNNDKQSWSLPHWNAKVVGYALPENKAPQGLTREEALFENDRSKPIQSLPKGAAYESADVPDNTYADGVLAERAVERLKFAAEHPEEPFFLAVGFVKPHLPFCAPKKYWDRYDPSQFKLAEVTQPPKNAPELAPTKWGELRQYRGIPEQGPLSEELQRTLIHGYYAAMSFMDAQVGRVLDCLQETGLAENTIVVLWGDHGWHLGDHGMWCKHTNYEQAARIPLLVRSPGGAEGKVASGMVETVDIFPTLAELAGLPNVTQIDGKSFAAAIQDPEAKLRDHIIHVFPRGQVLGRAIRTERYRLVEWKKTGAKNASNKGPSATDGSVQWELYDYQADPMETENHYSGASAEVLQSLKRLLNSHPEALPQIK